MRIKQKFEKLMGNKMKCPECKHETILEKEPMTFKFNPSVIVQDVVISRCTNCGFESVSEEEYEKVRKLVHQVKAPQGATIVVTA